MGEITREYLEELISAKIKESIEPLLKPERKPIYGDLSEDDIKSMDGKLRAVELLKAVVRGDGIAARALSEGVDTAGGYLVPEEFRAEVIRVARQYGIARRLCRVLPVRRDALKVPKLTSSVTVYWPDEGAVITTSQPAFGLVTITPKKCAGITPITSELLEDADVDVLEFLTQIFGEAIAKEEDKQLLTGTGSPITGLLGSADVNVVTMAAGKTSFADVTADDLLALIDAVDSGTEEGAYFFFHKNILTHLRKLKDSNGNYILQRPADGKPGTLWGYPYITTDVMPSNSDDGAGVKFIAFGNLRYVIFGDRKRMTVDVSKEATVGGQSLFERDMQALRVTERIDIQIAVPTAFAVLQTAAS